MEFGSPPLYSETNRVCREIDLTCLKELGPFVNAIGWICNDAEKNKEPCDKILEGSTLCTTIDNNLAGCFLLWRGAQMKKEQVDAFEFKKGDWIGLRGSTSCSRNPKVALNFAFNNLEGTKVPVLFVKFIRNYEQSYGIMLNSEAYSSYPSEGEYLLQEGYMVKILEIEHKFKIKNKN